MSKPSRYAVDFSLALHNRTGKYFIGRDLLESQSSLVGDIYYWRVRRSTVPKGLSAKVIGKLAAMEDGLRARRWSSALPRLRPSSPVLHLDPFTVVHSRLESRDMVLCHDLGPLTHQDLFDADVVALYKRAYAAITVADPYMIFVSKASRDAFWSHCGPVSREAIIYPPIRQDLGSGPVTPVPQVAGPFLLTVGSLGNRKNQARVIDAFARSGLADQGWSYVLCGSAEPGADAVLKRAHGTKNVHVLSYVDDATLAWLYSAASGFVLVSRLEGFGIPVAEAISRGLVPVITRNSVLEEVAGEGALAVDALDIDEIATALQTLADMPAEERLRRLNALQIAISRFTRPRFDKAWHASLSNGLAQTVP